MRSLALAALALLAASPAFASATFPPEIDSTLSLAAAPACTLCHQTLSGGFGTVVKPFGQQMQARGCAAGDLDSLNNALAALEGEASDVDGDGIGDIQELRDGTDPNSAGDASGPEYGCIGNVAPVRSVWPGAAVVLAALALIAVRRRPAASP